MITELHSNLYAASLEHRDLQIPGLHGNHLASLLLWHDNTNLSRTISDASHPQRFDSELIAVYEQAAMKFMSEPDRVGWICTVIKFPALWSDFIRANWISHSDRSIETTVWTHQIVWTALPTPDSADWKAFWNVPLDPVFTNMLVLRNGARNRIPPKFQVMAYPSSSSTFLHWPWMQQQQEQEEWLSEVEDALIVFASGIERHSVGVQLISRTSDLSILNSIPP